MCVVPRIVTCEYMEIVTPSFSSAVSSSRFCGVSVMAIVTPGSATKTRSALRRGVSCTEKVLGLPEKRNSVKKLLGKRTELWHTLPSSSQRNWTPADVSVTLMICMHNALTGCQVVSGQCGHAALLQ